MSIRPTKGEPMSETEVCPEVTTTGARCTRTHRVTGQDWRCFQHRNGHVLPDREALRLIEAHATPRDLMRLVDPNLSDKDADFLLWERTPFPLIQGVHDLVDYAAERFDGVFAYLTLPTPPSPAVGDLGAAQEER